VGAGTVGGNLLVPLLPWMSSVITSNVVNELPVKRKNDDLGHNTRLGQHFYGDLARRPWGPSPPPPGRFYSAA